MNENAIQRWRLHRRRLSRKLGAATAGLILLLTVTNFAAQAADFTANDATSLIQAINAANDETAYPGADTITLIGNVTLTEVNNSDINGDNGLPVIKGKITIQGAGHTIERKADAPQFRLVTVDAQGDLTFDQVTLRGGNSTRSGGGIYNDGGALTVNNSTIISNTTADSGGGITNSDGTVVVYNSTIFRNSGGGIANSDDGTVVVYNSTISDNSGSGIFNSGTITVRNSTISGNSGSGIFSYFGDMILRNSTITGNTARSGGGFSIYYGTATVDNSTITGNSSTDGGGGFFNSISGTTIRNSTISGNSARQGGGFFNNTGGVTVRNSTITGNSANRGGGFYNYYYAEVTLERSLISGNTATFGGNEAHTGVNSTVNTDALNLFGDSSQSTGDALANFTTGLSDITATSDGNTPTALDDILVTTLAENGGPTLTHALVAGSPAIDAAGDSGLDTDQRGKIRPQGIADDIGAFEYESLVAGDCNADMAVDAGDLSALVLEIFDGDGNVAADAPNGSFVGSLACDSNNDTAIDAADISCTVLIIFNGPGVCRPSQ